MLMRVEIPPWRGYEVDVWSVGLAAKRMALPQNEWPFGRAKGPSLERMFRRRANVRNVSFGSPSQWKCNHYHAFSLPTNLSFFIKMIRVSRFVFSSVLRLCLQLLSLPLWGRKVRSTPFEASLRKLLLKVVTVKWRGTGEGKIHDASCISPTEWNFVIEIMPHSTRGKKIPMSTQRICSRILLSALVVVASWQPKSPFLNANYFKVKCVSNFRHSAWFAAMHSRDPIELMLMRSEPQYQSPTRTIKIFWL